MENQTVEQRIAQLTQQLFQDGKLVAVHIAAWPAVASLSAHDLGLTDEEVPKFANLGTKQLIPAARMKIFNTIESRARGVLNLKQMAIPFPIGAAHFIPTAKVPEVLSRLNAYRDQFFGEVDRFVTEYAATVESYLSDNEAYRDKLEKHYPAADQIRSKFQFGISMFAVSFPTKMDEVSLQTLQAQQTAERELLDRQREDLAAVYHENFRTLNSFLSDAVTHVRGNIISAFSNVAERLRTGKVISSRNIASLSDVVESFKDVNFLNDSAVADQLQAVQALLVTGRDFKNDTEAKEALQLAVGQVLDAAQKVSDIDTVTGEYVRRIQV
jgi:hypothetical protein